MQSDRGGSRLVSIPSERLLGWLERFGQRHGRLTVAADSESVEVVAADGAAARLQVPFPPLPGSAAPLDDLVRHAGTRRRVGAVLVRRGGYAVGLFAGRQLTASKVGHSYVQGRTKAGGWSQQRYARRRANQAEQAYAQVADVVVTLVLPEAAALDAVVGGGDRSGVLAVLADPRLAGLTRLFREPVLPTVDPRLRVLEAFPDQFTAVRITLNELA